MSIRRGGTRKETTKDNISGLSYDYFQYWTRDRFTKRAHPCATRGGGRREYITLLNTHIHEKYNPVLDVGCGNGQLTCHLTFPCGVDININRLKRAKERGAIATQGNLLKLPFVDKAFEATYTIQVLMHIPNHVIIRALEELLRVTKKRILHIESYREEERKLASHCFNHDLETLYRELGIEMVYSKRLDTYETQVCSIFAPHFIETMYEWRHSPFVAKCE